MHRMVVAKQSSARQKCGIDAMCSSMPHRRWQLSAMVSMSDPLHTCAGPWLVPALLLPAQLVLRLDQQLACGLCDVSCRLAPLAGRGGCRVCGWYGSVTLQQQQAGSVRCCRHGVLQNSVQAASHQGGHQ